ncbi:MAG: polyprenyl synthetase family protein [Oscillospiraceae bacterium]|jgi:geranylgeranyl diphosphate synthase type II|nr:polyprenyl synthetase family protein [Oscillospiraceae bacterium]
MNVKDNQKELLLTIENKLAEILGNCSAPKVLVDAMRHSLLDAGKRVRPMLTLAFCEAGGGDVNNALNAACAVEMIHTYSLIHDDLPCMDNDDFRRGKPSCHKAFGEATALLAGDALLTMAFEVLMDSDGVPADMLLASCRELAHLAGEYGMIGGQVIDLQSEGKVISLSELMAMHKGKTCALIESACVLGCLSAGKDGAELAAAREYAYNLGMAFQIVDDILDVEGDPLLLGKPVASDAQNSKNTYVTLLGIDKAREEAAAYTDRAMGSLSIFGGRAEFLREFAQKLGKRIF